MVMSRVQTLVQLTDDLVSALDARAAREGVSRSQLIRTAIDRFMADESGIDRLIVEGYATMPPDQPGAEVMARAIESIESEPW